MKFDATLVKAAEAVGVRVLRRARFRDVVQETDGCWRLHFEQDGVPSALVAREVIDASGRSAIFGRRVGGRRIEFDRLVGLAADVTPTPGGRGRSAMLIEAAADGWWYAASLPGERSVAVFMTDAELLKLWVGPLRREFAARHAKTLHLSLRHCPLVPSFRLRVYPAGGQRLQPCVGPGWIAAGDAAVSFDPLASLGIGYAPASGVQAARIVHSRQNGDNSLANAYSGDVDRIHAAYASQHKMIYAAERRWTEQPFWRRRNDHPVVRWG